VLPPHWKVVEDHAQFTVWNELMELRDRVQIQFIGSAGKIFTIFNFKNDYN
jgi:hypothetical protein